MLLTSFFVVVMYRHSVLKKYSHHSYCVPKMAGSGAKVSEDLSAEHSPVVTVQTRMRGHAATISCKKKSTYGGSASQWPRLLACAAQGRCSMYLIKMRCLCGLVHCASIG